MNWPFLVDRILHESVYGAIIYTPTTLRFCQSKQGRKFICEENLPLTPGDTSVPTKEIGDVCTQATTGFTCRISASIGFFIDTAGGN